MDGIVLVDKETGITTTGVDVKIKRTFGTSKVGHAGTLDPFARGLVICGINKGTKILTYLESDTKTYVGILKLGEKTDTGDLDGMVIKEKKPDFHSNEEIEKAMKSLMGKQMQTPPMYSAVKLHGQPLYKYAREGIEVERVEREIEVLSFNLILYRPNNITFEAKVSKGTYIRTLAESLANKLKEVGHLTYLRRTRVGEFDLADAYTIDNVSEKSVIRIKDAIKFKQVNVKGKNLKAVENGNPITLDEKDERILILDEYGLERAIYYKDDETNVYKCEKVF